MTGLNDCLGALCGWLSALYVVIRDLLHTSFALNSVTIQGGGIETSMNEE